MGAAVAWRPFSAGFGAGSQHAAGRRVRLSVGAAGAGGGGLAPRPRREPTGAHADARLRAGRADQGESGRGSGGLTGTPWASSYPPPHRLHGVS